MPLITPLLPVIESPVSDRVSGDTRFRQKALFLNMFHQQLPNGIASVQVVVRVSLYAADATAPDGYGPRLTGSGLSSYESTLTADNTTLVDAATGEQLAQKPLGQTDVEWQAVIASFSQNTMLQGDFFLMLRESQPVQIGDMIRHHIQQADAMGRFA